MSRYTTQGKKEVTEAVAIAALGVLFKGLIEWGLEWGKELAKDIQECRKKAREAKEKAAKPEDNSPGKE